MPDFAKLTPVQAIFIFEQSAFLPVASKTVSNSSFLTSPVSLFLYSQVIFSSFFEKLTGTHLFKNFIPSFSSTSLNLSAISLSNPLKIIDLTINVTSYPKLLRKLAHSTAIYDAPIISVFPGAFCNLKISSEVIQNSFAPGASTYAGLKPVAINILSDVIVSFFPFLSVNSIVWVSINLANLL